MRASGLEHVTVLETDGAPVGLRRPPPRRRRRADCARLRPPRRAARRPARPSGPRRRSSRSSSTASAGRAAPSTTRARCSTSSRRCAACCERDGRLPVNLKFVVEGEEEVGSPHFEALLQRERDRLACDVVVVSDTSMWALDVPSTCVGMRGLVAFDVELRTAAADLHSGVYGGAVPNPAHHIARLVSALHDDERRVALPGFYDDVRPADRRGAGIARPAALSRRGLDGGGGRAPPRGRGGPLDARAGVVPPHVRRRRHRRGLHGRRHQDDRARAGRLQGHVPARPRPASRADRRRVPHVARTRASRTAST